MRSTLARGSEAAILRTPAYGSSFVEHSKSLRNPSSAWRIACGPRRRRAAAEPQCGVDQFSRSCLRAALGVVAQRAVTRLSSPDRDSLLPLDISQRAERQADQKKSRDKAPLERATTSIGVDSKQRPPASRSRDGDQAQRHCRHRRRWPSSRNRAA
jgi:hypothetical protein